MIARLRLLPAFLLTALAIALWWHTYRTSMLAHSRDYADFRLPYRSFAIAAVGALVVALLPRLRPAAAGALVGQTARG